MVVETSTGDFFANLVNTFQNPELGDELRISSLDTKTFLRGVAEEDNASPQQSVAVLTTTTKCRRAQEMGTILAVMNDSTLRKAGKKQVCRILRTITAVQFCRASDDRVLQWTFTLFRENAFPQFFLIGSGILQSARPKKKAAARAKLPQSVLTTTETLLLFYDIG